jgi:hypothetical protein
MADEDPMDSMPPEGADDDEFRVRLGWGDEGDEDPPSASLHVVDEWGLPWVDTVPELLETSPEDGLDRPTDGGPVDLHQIRTSLVELRNDVSALRRAVRASSELQELSLSIAELRAEVAELLEAKPLEEVRADIASLRSEVELQGNPSLPLSVLEPMLSEIGALRSDLVAMKRRVSLRATQPGERAVDDAELIARRVAEHLSAQPTAKRSRRG